MYMKAKRGNIILSFIIVLVLFGVVYTACKDVTPKTQLIENNVELKFNK